MELGYCCWWWSSVRFDRGDVVGVTSSKCVSTHPSSSSSDESPPEDDDDDDDNSDLSRLRTRERLCRSIGGGDADEGCRETSTKVSVVADLVPITA